MRLVPLAFAALLATALPTLASAQRVSADIRIGSGPVDGRILVGDPIRRHSHAIIEVDPRGYRRPVYREVAVYRIRPGYGWWLKGGYRAVTVWYDTDRARYYDHRDRYRDGLREVVIYERNGRYFDGDRDRYTDHRYDRRHDHRKDHEDDHDHDRD